MATQDTIMIGGMPYRSLKKDYVELKKKIQAAGIMDRQPVYYAVKFTEVILLYAASIAILFLVDNIWVQMLNAILLGFASTQAGFILHDAGHRQITNSTKADNLIGLIFGNLFMGASSGWWIEYHNEHHAFTNEVHVDPAIDHPFWAFDDQTALEASGFWRFMVRWQAYLYVPLMMFQAAFLRIFTFQRLLGPGKVKNRGVELVLVVVHLALYLGLIFIALPPLAAVAFIAIHHAFTGVYTGMVFAPNHKGMPTIEDGKKVDFMLQQTITTRNVAPHPLVDYLFGGLNYQIEHHLFPGTPRNRLGDSRRIIKAFCEDRGIPYHELGMLASYREMFAEMDETGKQTLRTVAPASGD
ncbi:MAG: acyl-CoA desaturase [Chloroflexi bacterium]|nr:acyl-CoA desaturase [Chloroflexota bacterium]